MNFPVWDVRIGSHWLIALVAVVHVFISHFAIGGGLFLVIFEGRAHRHEDHELLSWLHGFARFFVLLTVVAGALTGVWIWFTIGLISPEATSNLIHIFVWGWAIEWVLFGVEILAILVYFYGWQTIPRAAHRLVGWVYFAAAWLSLAVINGILSFQLTPGRWLQTGRFWDAFFNPGYWPSLAVRTVICVLLGGLFALAVGSFLRQRSLRIEVSRYSSLWVLISAAALPPAVSWYLRTVPAASKALFEYHKYLHRATNILIVAATLLIILAMALGWFKLWNFRRPVAAFALFLGLVSFGCIEWIREDLRNPYMITGYLYANQIPVRQEASIRQRGILKSARFVSLRAIPRGYETRAGKEIYRIFCSACHRARRGTNALAPKVRELDVRYAAGLLARTDLMRGGMPPFLGTPREAKSVARYLKAGSSWPPSTMDGKRIWELRCKPCHTLGGQLRPLGPAFRGMTAAEIADVVAIIGDMSPNMPAWTGSDPERQALGQYFALAVGKVGGAP